MAGETPSTSSRILYWAMRGLFQTYQVAPLNPERRPTPPYLYAIWHQNLIASLAAERERTHCMIVSRSRDGELVAGVCQRLGHLPLRGSSNRGGASALKGMVRTLREGIPGCIAVDGPRGPCHQVKKGIFELSRLADTPVVPLLAIPDEFWSFPKSWDRFRVPKPFAHIGVWYGEAMTILREDKEDNYQRAEQELLRQFREAEHQIKFRR